MRTNPVSFKSLFVFTLNDKAQAPIPDIIRAAFKNNDILKSYYVDKDMYVHNEDIDGTLFNAHTNFCQELDRIHKNILPKGSKRVKISEAQFYVDAHNKEPRYYITAATTEDEEKIHRILSKSNLFYIAKFRGKPV